MRGVEDTCSIYLDVLPHEAVNVGDIVASMSKTKRGESRLDRVNSVYLVQASRVVKPRKGKNAQRWGRVRYTLKCLRGTVEDVCSAIIGGDFAGQIWWMTWYPRGKAKS